MAIREFGTKRRLLWEHRHRQSTLPKKQKAAANFAAASVSTQVQRVIYSDDRPATSHETIDDHDQGDHEEQVDESSADVKRKKAECPENEQDDSECPQHDWFLD